MADCISSESPGYGGRVLEKIRHRPCFSMAALDRCCWQVATVQIHEPRQSWFTWDAISVDLRLCDPYGLESWRLQMVILMREKKSGDFWNLELPNSLR